ncbi:unnamed protein product [Acidithrix sp. C25]|nr:unnamed protein product [Acidithrix sp. C25]
MFEWASAIDGSKVAYRLLTLGYSLSGLFSLGFASYSATGWVKNGPLCR